MTKKKCFKCGKNRNVNKFSVRNKKTGLLQSWCIDCRSKYDRARYETDTEKFRLWKKNSTSKNDRREFIIKFLSTHPCVDCGEKDPIVLDFDHQHSKAFNISFGIHRGYSIDRIVKEIAKCEVVCANCHRRRTAIQENWYKHHRGVAQPV